MWKKAVIGLLVLIAALATVYAFLPKPVSVEMGPVLQDTVVSFVSEEAKLRLADEYLVAMPIQGTLERITLKEGDWVEADTIVARVDTTELDQHLAAMDARIIQAEAQIAGIDVQKPKPETLAAAASRTEEAEARVRVTQGEAREVSIRLEEAERALERQRQLAARGFISAQQLERVAHEVAALIEVREAARNAVEAAKKARDTAASLREETAASVDDNAYMRDVYRAEKSQLEAQRALLSIDKEKAEIRAPVAGPVLTRHVTSRQTLAPGTPILSLGDLSTLEIESDILSEEAVAIDEGAKVEIEGRALQGDTLAGTVKRIYPSAFTKISSLGIEQQRIKVLIDFDNEGRNLRPGTRLDLRIITGESVDTLVVPERATFRREGQWHVFAVKGKRARLRPITLGLKNNAWAEVLEGVEVGETILYEPQNELEDGSPVVAR